MHVYITKRHDNVFYILNGFFNKLQIFTERSRCKRSYQKWLLNICTYKYTVYSIQADHSCSTAAYRRRNCGSGKGKNQNKRKAAGYQCLLIFGYQCQSFMILYTYQVQNELNWLSSFTNSQHVNIMKNTP